MSTKTRAVAEIGPRITTAEWSRRVQTLDFSGEARGEEEVEEPVAEATWTFDDAEPNIWVENASTPIAPEVIGPGVTQLDPGIGPLDLGYPFLVDLGAGDAPYDDGVETIHGEEKKRGGFSDTVIQLQWRHQLRPEMSVLGGASLFRQQDLSIIDGLHNAQFGWAVLGIQLRF